MGYGVGLMRSLGLDFVSIIYGLNYANSGFEAGLSHPEDD